MSGLDYRTRLGRDRTYIIGIGFMPTLAMPPSLQVMRSSLRNYNGEIVADVSLKEKAPNIFVGSYTPLRDGLIVANVLLPMARMGAYSALVSTNDGGVPDVSWQTLAQIDGASDDIEDAIDDVVEGAKDSFWRIVQIGAVLGAIIVAARWS